MFYYAKFVFTDVCCYRRKFCNCECRSESDWKLNSNAFKDCQPCPDTPPDPPCRVKTIEKIGIFEMLRNMYTSATN